MGPSKRALIVALKGGWLAIAVGVVLIAIIVGTEVRSRQHDPCVLLKAVRVGDPDAKQRLLNAGLALTPCTQGQEHEYPIHIAAEVGDVHFLGDLLSRGANPDQRDGNGSAPIRRIVGGFEGAGSRASDYERCVDMLISSGADIDAQSDVGWTALHHAAVYARTKSAKLLLSRGAGPNVGDNRGQTPLHLAAGDRLERGLGVVEVLIAAGADPTLRDNDGHQPIDIARDNGFQEIAKVLSNAAAK